MDPTAQATIIRYHRDRVKSHGAGTVGALGWRDAASQRKRFEVVAAAADFTDACVLDVGCGHGDLLPFLVERFAGIRYLGIDRVAEFIELAASRHAAHPAAEFACADFSGIALPHADIVVACGTLGYRCADELFVYKAIAQLSAAAARCLIFTVLDERAFAPHPLLLGRDVAAIEAFCRNLAPCVEVVRGYLPDDAAVVMRTSGA